MITLGISEVSAFSEYAEYAIRYRKENTIVLIVLN